MNIGATRSEIEAEIRSAISLTSDIHAIFGFGSCFRDRNFSDVDILVILAGEDNSLLASYYNIREKFSEVGQRLGLKFDIVALTLAEYEGRPLRDMDSLVRIISN